MGSFFTGEKKFFMGEQPTELDCAAFGQLAQIRWHTPDSCPGKTLMKGAHILFCFTISRGLQCIQHQRVQFFI